MKFVLLLLNSTDKPQSNKMATISIVGSAPIKLETSGSISTKFWFFHYLSSLGYKLISNSSGDILISINHNQHAYRQYVKGGGSRERAFLIRLEPVSVYPGQYNKKIESQYRKVFTPGFAEDYKTRTHFVGWPYTFNLNPSKPLDTDPELVSWLNDNFKKHENVNVEIWKTRPIKAVMIAANKVSPLKNNNYKIRRKIAMNLPPDTLEVYGPLWNGQIFRKIRHRIATAVFTIKSRKIPNPVQLYGNLFGSYKTAKGEIPDKHNLLRDSKFSIVIENSITTMSEKLIDSVLNGSVPIYLGPELISLGLPPKLAIPFNGQVESLLEILNNTPPKEIAEVLLQGAIFIESENFLTNWTEKGVYTQIANSIDECLKEL